VRETQFLKLNTENGLTVLMQMRHIVAVQKYADGREVIVLTTGMTIETTGGTVMEQIENVIATARERGGAA